ncbi:endogenous retrovirus group 3 member 1 Env polyprotein-like [Perca fluviatilis]|uniref:endogenous retrovirus group 3 member 1 Env polyprotein-like n=1 Tax=Perca fluviatilis TaxID=8168 RepID=UPI0019650651|nr:endogenous retrovirus group 3 member 1 Env polyprotein-like [Perca fluviatilis]
MSLIQRLLILILVESTMGAPQVMKVPDIRADAMNVFMTMAWQVANHIYPNSSCYVCGLMPYTAGEGLPLMALPPSDCDTCHLMHIPLSQSYSHPDCSSLSKMRPLDCSTGHANCYKCLKTPKPVPIQLIPQKFPWCLQNDGETPVGQSDCLRTFKWDPELTNIEFKSLDSAPHNCLEAAGQARFSALAHRTASCTISSPVGMYWVCGNLAYPYLPVDYNGRCGLAYIIPAMRVAHSLPQKPLKRVQRGLSDTFGTHHQSNFKNVLGPLLPFYGVMSALDQIADLSQAIEVIANETGKALMLLSSELASVRLVALQNRAALDFLLAARGGTCAVIGAECCTFVPDNNATIGDIVNHLHNTANSVHQDSSSLFDWLKTAFGTVSYHVVEVMITLVVFIVLMSLFSSCVKKFIFKIR